MTNPSASFQALSCRRASFLFTACLLACSSLPAWAAPGDVFLTATPEQIAPRGYVEVAADQMNSSLDFFRVRDSNPLTAGTKTGDYHGAHVTGAVRVGEGKWLSGGLWQRAISSSSDTYDYTSWQVGGLYRFAEPAGWRPAMALRLSAWGNYASATESTTAVVVPGAKLNTVKITDPADHQLQADVIGSWNLSPSTDVSASFGLGSSKLSYGALSATTTRNGCDYQLTFNGNDIFGTLAAPCSVPGGVIQQFYDSSGAYGVDVANEIAWRGTFLQAGVNGSWRRGPWTLQAGYLLYVAKRINVDDILASRGKPSYTQNQTLALHASYRLRPQISVFARGQLTSNFLMSDVPVTYNTSTSDRFESRYSVFSIGLIADF